MMKSASLETSSPISYTRPTVRLSSVRVVPLQLRTIWGYRLSPQGETLRERVDGCVSRLHRMAVATASVPHTEAGTGRDAFSPDPVLSGHRSRVPSPLSQE